MKLSLAEFYFYSMLQDLDQLEFDMSVTPVKHSVPVIRLKSLLLINYV